MKGHELITALQKHFASQGGQGWEIRFLDTSNGHCYQMTDVKKDDESLATFVNIEEVEM